MSNHLASSSTSSDIAISSKPSRIHQILTDINLNRNAYFLTAVASFGGMFFGWDTGLIGGILTMDSFKHSFSLDSESSSYANLSGNIVSTLQGGCFFGAMSSFYVSDVFGRKTALFVADFFFLVGSIIQTTSGMGTDSLTQLYIGRFIGGFGVGLVSAVVPTYIGENASREIRGRCIGCMQLFNVTGIMLAYFINFGINKDFSGTNDLKWRIPFALQMIPGVLLLLGLLFQNESPRWLVEKDRHEEALAALSRVRRKSPTDPSLVQEYREIVADFEGKERLTLIQQMRLTISSKPAFYAVSMAAILQFWQQWTGTNSINYYSPQIFSSIGLTGTSNGLFATGIYGVVKVCITALGLMFATEQLGRKWCLIIGGIGQAFAMFYIGINQAVNPPVAGHLTGHSIFAIVCVYLFVVFYSFGWGPIPFVLSSECSPNHLRSFSMAFAIAIQWLMNFVISKITPYMLSGITYGTFLLFGACCVVMTIYAVVCVPETKNVPLERVHLLFEGEIIKGAFKDTLPRFRRAQKLREMDMEDGDDVKSVDGGKVTHIERVNDHV
ncbi:quinate permease protein [Rutstroemia sp. NJR-2017a BBW]|nr:quinate permease protein [Rutstroemia sp. NJR-2017a BBW]